MLVARDHGGKGEGMIRQILGGPSLRMGEWGSRVGSLPKTDLPLPTRPSLLLPI